jgi:dCTP diphosphatase
MSFPLDKIQKQLRVFAKEREWDQFHTPKNLAIALSVEASELLEIFQWLDGEKKDFTADQEENIREEIADVGLYLFRLCDILKIDLEEVMKEKIEKNAVKYPADQVRGSAKKYNEY